MRDRLVKMNNILISGIILFCYLSFLFWHSIHISIYDPFVVSNKVLPDEEQTISSTRKIIDSQEIEPIINISDDNSVSLKLIEVILDSISILDKELDSGQRIEIIEAPDTSQLTIEQQITIRGYTQQEDSIGQTYELVDTSKTISIEKLIIDSTKIDLDGAIIEITEKKIDNNHYDAPEYKY